MFKKERDIQFKLKSKYIVELYEFLESKSNYYFIMEYCPHGELGIFINKHAGGKF